MTETGKSTKTGANRDKTSPDRIDDTETKSQYSINDISSTSGEVQTYLQLSESTTDAKKQEVARVSNSSYTSLRLRPHTRRPQETSRKNAGNKKANTP